MLYLFTLIKKVKNVSKQDDDDKLFCILSSIVIDKYNKLDVRTS